MTRIVAVLFATAVMAGGQAVADNKDEVPAALNHKMKKLDGQEVALSKYLGNVVLVVNVASECGLTPQYEQLQALHQKYAPRGLSIIAFPCNQFGQQEPGTAAQIRQFCTQNYGVEFDLFEKVDVNGDGACALYQHLTQLKTKPAGSGEIGWNFEKFLIDRSGQVVARFQPSTRPDAPEVVELIENKLADK